MLSSREKEAETIYEQMRLRRLSKDQFVSRMKSLEKTRKGNIACCYCVYLLLRNLPGSAEKDMHMNRMTAMLRAELQSHAVRSGDE